MSKAESGGKELRDRAEAAEAEAARLRAETSRLEDLLRRSDAMRRQMHNTIQELRGNIRVLCRVRPLLPREIKGGGGGGGAGQRDQGIVQFPSPTHEDLGDPVLITQGDGGGRKKSNRFTFDRVGEPIEFVLKLPVVRDKHSPSSVSVSVCVCLSAYLSLSLCLCVSLPLSLALIRVPTHSCL